jgi:hypothetical protein
MVNKRMRLSQSKAALKKNVPVVLFSVNISLTTFLGIIITIDKSVLGDELLLL